MKFRLNPMLTALIATGACGFANAAAVVSAPEVRTESRTVIVDSDVSIHNGQGHADVFITQSEPGSARKDVRVFTSGSGQHFAFADMPDVNVIVSNAISEAFSHSSSTPVIKSVKNAPYSAEVISEKVQMLPDGNQLTRKISSMSYRDSAGRTRQETRDATGEVKIIHINDAIDGSRYILSPGKKSATKITLDKDLQKRIEEIREKAKAMAKEGKGQIIERSSAPGEEIIVKRIESPVGADGKKELREEVKVNVVRMSGNPKVAVDGQGAIRMSANAATLHSEMPQLSGLMNSFQDVKWSSKSTTTQLGTRDFDGVRAEGKNVSYTIPAGEIGNKNPIVVSTETWYSPELQMTVYSKISDPRVGDSIYRLTNIKRGEPAATLFMVPDGYSVKDTPSIGVRTAK
ncbi:MAG: hypothetical protein JNN20_18315 [Betaproteobacteria bacterium]|nr:hypothetical protein [Betaproteobacteria bacterium]